MIGRPPNKTCLICGRKSIYPEKDFSDWFYPREQTCFDCLMIRCNRFDKIRARKLPGEMNDRVDLLFPLTVYDTSNNTKIGEYHTKQDVLAAVHNYKQERKSRAKILVIHYQTVIRRTKTILYNTPCKGITITQKNCCKGNRLTNDLRGKGVR